MHIWTHDSSLYLQTLSKLFRLANFDWSIMAACYNTEWFPADNPKYTHLMIIQDTTTTDIDMLQAVDVINNLQEQQLWYIMEQSLKKLRHLHQRTKSSSCISSELQQKVLLKETFRDSCWQMACMRAEEDGDDAVQRVFTMARLTEQCLWRTGLMGRMRITIEPDLDLTRPPKMRLSMGHSRPT